LRAESKLALAASPTDEPAFDRQPEAEADITDAAVWYESRASGFGLELLSEVNSAMARALENPESLTCSPQSTVRRILTRRFPYRVFFIDRQDALVFFSVLQQQGMIEFGRTV
jgi:plasmid stabilization system protein ParE